MVVAMDEMEGKGNGSKAAPEGSSSNKVEEIDKTGQHRLFLPRA
jgi:hypothetical protein